MSDVEHTPSDDAIVSEAPETAFASAPARSDDDAKTGVGSASEQPDASAASQQQSVASASEQPDASAASQEAQPDASQRQRRKSREGVVVSSSMDKTVVIAVIERVRHPKYNKFVLQTKRLYAHDETNDINVGDKVRVMETRPLSKQKRWRVTDVLERAK